MNSHNTKSDPEFCFPSSSSVPTPGYHQKPQKKRTKMIKIEPKSLVPSSSTSTVISKPKYYGKKPDPSAPKITRPCSECGKKFWSWKALFGHMRCHPERQWRGINPPPNYRRPISPIQQPSPLGEAILTAEDHEVASCLLMLANSDEAAILETECCGGGRTGSSLVQDGVNCRFECSSCQKVFGSHQALGGHRASHKNVKGCFAITRNDGYEVMDQDPSGSGDVKENVEDNTNNKMVVVLGHQCSICLRVFSSGQALGGHKRCHWEKGEEASSSMDQGLNVFSAKEGCGLDLNLPAPIEDESSSSYSSGPTLDLRLGL